MNYHSLISYEKKYGKCDNDLIIVISAFVNYDLLLRHLGYLSEQTFQKFDVLLILGVPFDDKKLGEYLKKRKFRFGVILAKENKRRGCSGAFFTGQKYVLENNYRYMIMADDDCMPIDKQLVENLYKNREKRYLSGKVDLRVTKDFVIKSPDAGASHYTLYDTDILRKYGLYYMPLFHGADDGEYFERIREKKYIIDNYVEHPYSFGGKFVLANLDRAMLFFIASLCIMKNPRSTIHNLALFSFFLPVYLIFFPSYGKKLFFILSELLLTYTFGKKASEKIKSGFETFISSEKDISIENFRIIDDANPEYTIKAQSNKILSIMLNAASNLRKNIVTKNTFSYLKIVALAITARKIYAKTGDDRYLLIADNSNPITHLLRILCFILLFPVFFAAMFIFFIPIKIIKQPNTLGYGLD